MMKTDQEMSVEEGRKNESSEMGDSLGSHSSDLHEEITSELSEQKLIDYAALSKKELADVLKDLLSESDFRKVDHVLKEVKPHFDEIRVKEKTQALEKFLADGGLQADFEYRPDAIDNLFDANYKLIRDKRASFLKNQEEEKNENLRKKSELLEKLRSLVDRDDSEHSFRTFKEIQTSWKQIGAIPQGHSKTMWATYNALIDRFYDQRSIYFELKELDRKKNLELKKELCAKAEKLLEASSIHEAIRELNEVHEEFRHVGPVPIEEKEIVWQRLKAASDAIYAKRDAYVANLQKELESNLQAKTVVCEEVAPFAAFSSDKIKEWNQQTQLILAIQKKWDAIGAVPRSKTKDVNKKFWSAFKLFFHNKNQYFKKLDEERSRNLQMKNDLIKAAGELKESTDWESTANELKRLQLRWKEIGPVPEKQREKVYQEFKAACDHFFEQRRLSIDQADKEYEENLNKKEAIVSQMDQHITNGSATIEIFRTLNDQFQSVGFVPKKSIAGIKEKFDNACERFLNSIPSLNSSEKDQLQLSAQVAGLKNDPNAEKKLYHKEQSIKKQIAKVENDIAVLRNNLEFFGRSKNAEKFKEDFNNKILEASDHLAQLKKQLKILQTAS